VAWVALLATYVLSTASLAGEKFPPELVRFRPYEKNPVFKAGGLGHWDARIRERGWVLREGDRWHLWYTGYDGTREGLKMLGYATSRDGLKWARHGEAPIYKEHWVEDMMVVRHEGTYYLFAEGRGDRPQLLTSKDGIHWKREGQLDVRRKDGRPIERGPYGTPTAWRENGVWHLFYERSDKGVWLAKSRDLKTWTNVSDEPVLRPGPGQYDKQLIALNQIVQHAGRYYAYYHGSGDAANPRRWTTNVATSTDLVRWEKYAGNPLLPLEANKSSGILVHDGQQFRLYTMHDEVHVHFPAGSAGGSRQ
jgi:sucrose-6-phosphate hydrolase SacC (GH32 family)